MNVTYFFFLHSRSVWQLQVSSGIECATLTVPNAVEGAAWYAGDAESNGHERDSGEGQYVHGKETRATKFGSHRNLKSVYVPEFIKLQ